MGYNSVINDMIEQKIMGIHTAYIAKVLSTNGETAKIQPLGKVKAYGEKAKIQSPLSNVPIIQSARYKITKKTITYVTDISYHSPITETDDFAILKPLSAGDIVIVGVCERNITDAKKGVNSTPVIGHHNMSDSVIIGIL